MTRLYIIMVILIMLSAIFSGSEIAFASSSEIKLRKSLEKKPNIINKKTYAIFQNYEKALITILLGNNLVNIFSSSIAATIALSIMGDNGVWLSTLIMTVVIITFGEITPKIIAEKRPEKFAKVFSLFIFALMIITFPVVYIASRFVKLCSNLWKENIVDEAVTEDDLETIIETVEDEGVVDEDTADLLSDALNFDEVLAYEIITPRIDMEAIDIEDDDEKIKQKVLNAEFSRLPVYRETPDKIIGFIHVTAALRQICQNNKINFDELILKPQFVYKTMPLPDVLELMKKTKCHLVIVTDEYGGTMGLLTMEDVMEQLVGEIWDEKDEIDEEYVELSEDTFEVDGDMRLEDFFDELDMDIDDEEINDDNTTIGGWAIEQLEDYPKIGDKFNYKNLSFEITNAEDMRVLTLKVIKN